VISKRKRLLSAAAFLLAAFLSLPAATLAEDGPKLVLIKLDGVSWFVLEAAVNPSGPATDRLPYPEMFRDAHRQFQSILGKRVLLPNFQTYFFQEAVRTRTMYSGTLALSTPSWSMIDTGQPTIVKANSSFNRFSGRLSFYLDQVRESRNLLLGAGKTTALWQLDLLGVPILIDAFPPERSWTAIQPFYRQRPHDQLSNLGRHLVTRGQPGRNPFSLLYRHLKGTVHDLDYPEKNDEAVARLAARKVLEELEGRERYDVINAAFFTIDHQIHLDADYRNILTWLIQVDSWVGEIMAAVHRSGRSRDTLAAIVSDHGLDFDPVNINYAFPINRWLRDPRFGAHNTLATLVENSAHALSTPIRGFDFNRLYESQHSPYGNKAPGGEKGYATAFTANNGNPRFDAFLRNSDLNRLHMMLLDIRRLRRDPHRLEVIYPVFSEHLEAARNWLKADAARAEAASKALLHKAHTLEADPDPYSVDSARRLKEEAEEYRRILVGLNRLLSIPGERDEWMKWARSRFKVSQLLPKGYMGPPNNLEQLRNYVSGWVQEENLRWIEGPAAFRTVDYPEVLAGFRAASPNAYGNPYPFAFFSTRLPLDQVNLQTDQPLRQVIWLKFSRGRGEALMAESESGDLMYQPIRPLAPAGSGYAVTPDPNSDPLDYTGLAGRWLTPRQWGLETESKEYSVVPVILADLFRENHEFFLDSPHLEERLSSLAPQRREEFLSALRFRFEQKTCDFRVWTNPGWNVNTNAHTPGGSHGAFNPLDVRTVFAVWGGSNFPLKRGSVVEGAYFTYDILPTLLNAMGRLDADGHVIPATGADPPSFFPPLPGTVIPLFEPSDRHAAR
jgi:hypothetical protein